MPRNELVITIFVSSPSGLGRDREIIDDLVEEMNVIFSKSLNVRIEVFSFDDIAPGVGTYPQEVINKSVKDKYDVFLGLVGSRFGTPTPSAGSGTEEEFNTALERYKSGKSVEIMFYLNEMPISHSDLDLDQLQKVRQFKERLIKEGILYRNFKTYEQFETALRLGLTDVVNKIKNSHESSTATPAPIEKESKKTESKSVDELSEIEEPGILENSENAKAEFAKTTECIYKYTQLMNDLDSKFRIKVQRLSDLKPGANVFEDGGEARKIMDDISFDLEDFSKRFSEIFPEYRSSARAALVTTSKVLVQIGGLSDGRNQVERARVSLESFKKNMLVAVNNLRAFQKVIVIAPNFTKRFNKARNDVAKSVRELSDEMMYEIDNIEEIEKMLVGFLDKK